MNDNIFFSISDLKKCGKNVIIGKTVRIRHPELVEIGDNVIIDDFTYISGNVKIGSFVHIASSCTIQAGHASIEIGSFVGISAGCRIFAVTSNYLIPSLDLPVIQKKFSYGSIHEDTRIGDDVLIGANCVVLNGVVIPNGVAFGAGLTIRKKEYVEWRLYSDCTEKPKLKRNSKKYFKKKQELLYEK
jgi:acetyltransferase-like isoleucine patch superfamily enzyme